MWGIVSWFSGVCFIVVGVGWVVGWLSRASLVLNGVAFRPLGGWLGSLDASSRRLGSLVATIAGAGGGGWGEWGV